MGSPKRAEALRCRRQLKSEETRRETDSKDDSLSSSTATVVAGRPGLADLAPTAAEGDQPAAAFPHCLTYTVLHSISKFF